MRLIDRSRVMIAYLGNLGLKDSYVCQLRPFIPDANGKPPCLCKDCSNCECLVEFKEIYNEIT